MSRLYVVRNACYDDAVIAFFERGQGASLSGMVLPSCSPVDAGQIKLAPPFFERHAFQQIVYSPLDRLVRVEIGRLSARCLRLRASGEHKSH